MDADLAKSTRVNATKSGMSAEDMRSALKAEGLSLRGFARLTGINERTAHAYGRGEQEIPPWVGLVLGTMAAARRLGFKLSVTADKGVVFSQAPLS